MAEFLLSAFADEGGKTIEAQIKALKDNNLTHIEPRGINGVNISDYTPEMAKELRKILDDNGIGVSAIGSPFGKINITDDFEPHFEKFKRNVETACILGTKNIRMFSFYIEGDTHAQYRDEVMARLERFCDYSVENGIWCCHENEKGIYGDNAERCLDILSTLDGKIKGVFDPANFIQCEVEIIPAYEMLKDYIEYMHIKDARMSDGFVVPCGCGDGCIPQLLEQFNKKEGKRFLTLEPHLKVFDGLKELEQEGGTADVLKDNYNYASNEEAFAVASQALHSILAEITSSK